MFANPVFFFFFAFSCFLDKGVTLPSRSHCTSLASWWMSCLPLSFPLSGYRMPGPPRPSSPCPRLSFGLHYELPVVFRLRGSPHSEFQPRNAPPSFIKKEMKYKSKMGFKKSEKNQKKMRNPRVNCMEGGPAGKIMGENPYRYFMAGNREVAQLIKDDPLFHPFLNHKKI